MPNVIARVVAPLLLALAGLAGAAMAQSSAGVTVLSGVTIVDPALAVPLRDATVVLLGERIAAVGPRRSVAIPANARLIDARGKFLIPGLWDMHTHIAQKLSGIPLGENADYFFPLFMAHGVTGIRDMAGDLTTLRRWRGEIASGARVGPHLVVTGEKLGKGPVVPGAPYPVRTRRDVERSMKALWDSGAAFVKLDAVAPSLVSSIMELAWNYGLRVAGHVEVQYSVRDLARAGLRSVEHLDGVLLASVRAEDSLRRVLVRQQGYSLWHRALTKLGVRTELAYPEAVMLQRYDSARADSLYAIFRATGTWHCPTLRLLGALYREQDANLRLAPDSLLLRQVPARANGFPDAPFARDHPLTPVYAGLQRVVHGMARAGVGILAGTDTPGLHAVPGRSLHDELGLLVAAGLTPRQALHAATTGAADFLEARDSLGTIRPGAFADLVLLDGDPLADIGNTRRIHAVVGRGRYFDRAALDRMIAEAARVARRVRGGGS